MRRPGLVLIAGAAVSLLCVSCSDDKNTPVEGPSASVSPAPTAPPASPTGGDDAIAGSVSKNVGEEPSVQVPKSEPPKKLLTEDVVPGDGAVAATTSTVTVRYVGYHYATGKPFDSSWDRDQPDTFSLNGVFVGLARGIAGMREGGRREMVIPPSLAYGEKGQDPVGPNETLLFVVDLVKVGPAAPA